MGKFPGFSPEAVQFFKGLRKNNTREWFQPRKEIFDTEIRAPMEELVRLLNGEFGKFAPLHIAEPKKAIFRIYRDTRFSSDKTPYKTNISATFPRQGMEKFSAAGYYVSVSDQEIEIGGGMYMSDREGLLAVRDHLAQNYQRFGRIAGDRKTIEALGPLHGETLTRVPKGFDAEHPAAAWIRMKQWMFFKTLDGTMMRSPELVKEIAGRFKRIAPLVEFLNEPLVKVAKKPSAAEMMF